MSVLTAFIARFELPICYGTLDVKFTKRNDCERGDDTLGQVDARNVTSIRRGVGWNDESWIESEVDLRKCLSSNSRIRLDEIYCEIRIEWIGNIDINANETREQAFNSDKDVDMLKQNGIDALQRRRNRKTLETGNK